MQHVAAGAGEGALVTRLFLALQRAPGFRRRVTRINGHRRLLVGKQYPVARFFRQIAPRHVDVVPERYENIAQVLALPRGWPRRYGALAYRKTVIWHHRAFGDFIDPSEAVA